MGESRQGQVVADNGPNPPPGERPPLPGSPYVVAHRLHRRIGYVIVALSLSLYGNFGNALVSKTCRRSPGATA